MMELLTAKEVTVVGILLVAIWWLIKRNSEAWNSLTENGRIERERIADEYKSMREESKQERKEWLSALAENTNQLKNVADKLSVIPSIQHDLDELKCKVDVLTDKR